MPLGATWDGAGVNVAVRTGAAAHAVDLCLYDAAGHEVRLALPERTGDVWHGYVPDVGPGQRYGFRVTGPFGPHKGQRYDPQALLLDPRAHRIEGTFRLDDADGGSSSERQNTNRFVPRSVVVDDRFDWGHDATPRTPWVETVLYELHVKGFTARHPDIPEAIRGTYAGLAHPAAIAHLRGLGITTVELLPVQAFVSEPHLLRRGLSNHWGYSTIGWFAPHPGYCSPGGDPVTEFKAMVQALHAAGLEVLLDVVYNHSGEGDQTGPTLSHRGLDNEGTYRLDPADRSRYLDTTGTGNSLDLSRPAVLQLVADSLRYWVTEMHVDGFRFDLASSLTRGEDGSPLSSAFLAVVAQDPVLSEVKLIAEPWDVAPDGYLVGRFPAPWAEWNDRYRDTVRDTWRGQGGGVRELASRLSGSSDLYRQAGRAPWSSVNFVTAHDGFTLHDLTSYDSKHNEANGEDGRDGESHNRSWNCGVEGPTDDPAVEALRRRQARNFLTTLLLSSGTPMLSMGDEVRRTQLGNNNAYCQDGPLSWQPWQHHPDAEDLYAWTSRLVQLRTAHPVFRQASFFLGQSDPHGVRDIAWFGADGRELQDEQWFDPARSTLGMYLDGRAIRARGPHREQIVDDSFLLVLHAGSDPLQLVLPGPAWAHRWHLVLDSAQERPEAESALPAGDVTIMSRSAVLLRAEREASSPNPRPR